ncbi:hypothetical protein SAMN05216232_0498 [Virgibacillus subterraneus]|uniref:Uncharacterized protein n=1 Tax=Virgibacillus subterraneus TaxID=621109 RepID=A0A1H8ZNT6_9BACI|nr:hypothetical protein [Virgibacillus subterraneus]SEP65883.1 hypothetical protein SAMN05216232_0498 [Virgibacillus subterraneus]
MIRVIKQQIKELEQEIFRKKRALAELRKKDEQKYITDDELREADGRKVKLNKLFGDHKHYSSFKIWVKAVIIAHCGLMKSMEYSTIWKA